jgi:hypothetical protein
MRSWAERVSARPDRVVVSTRTFDSEVTLAWWQRLDVKLPSLA